MKDMMAGVILVFSGAVVPSGFVDRADTVLATYCQQMIERDRAELDAERLVPGFNDNSPEWREAFERQRRELRYIIKLPDGGTVDDLNQFLREQMSKAPGVR